MENTPTLHVPPTSALWLDRFGAGVSLACAAHCLAAPVLLSLLPMAGLSVLAGESAETVFLIGALALAGASLCWGLRIHGRVRLCVLFGAAALLIAAGRLWVEHTAEVVCVTGGAGMLATGHLLNRRWCAACVQCPPSGPYSAD